MLDELLKRIRAGGVYSTRSLAQELGTSVELVEAMLEDLRRAGYLAPVEGCDKGTCAGCPAACERRGRRWRSP